VIISPDEMNKNIFTIIIASLTTQSHFYLTCIPLKFIGEEVWIVITQLYTLDRKRLIENLGEIDQKNINQVKSIIKVNQRCQALLGNFLRVWVGRGSLWYNKKNIICFGVGFLKW